MKIYVGSTRIAICIGPFAIKIPVLTNWEMFLKGLVGNITERKWAKLQHHNLPKIHYSSSTGFFAIHERVRPVRHVGLFWLDLSQICATSDLSTDFWLSDPKPSNFGYRGTTLVKVDYA